MTPTSLLRTLCILVGVLTVVLIGGCKVPSFFERPAPPPPVAPAPPVTPTPDLSQQALDTVTAYLSALDAHNYAAAYKLLSRESQSGHTRAEFEKQGTKGMTPFDLKTARVAVKGATATVDLDQLEDPATHRFTLAREDGTWKVVYRVNVPYQPRAE